MRIVYGIHGYGRGHAMRALAVLPELVRRHEMLILAGGDGWHALSERFPVVRIPMLGYRYNRHRRISNWRTLTHNLPMVLDYRLGGPTFQWLADVVRDFAPDVLLTDSETYTHHIGRRLGIPRITFDHYGVLVYCRLPLRGWDRFVCWGSGLTYRWLFGEPERLIVSAFFDAESTRPGVQVVGPVIRQEVRDTQPTRGEHLLAYINKGESEYTRQIDEALQGLDCPVRVYGVPQTGRRGNLEFKPFDNLAFIADVASARAVFATTGNQLCGEVAYFGKPILGMPHNCVEQRLNAIQIERMGMGLQIQRRQVTAQAIRSFLAREEEFAENARKRRSRDGAREALEAIERYARELTGRQETPDAVRAVPAAGRVGAVNDK